MYAKLYSSILASSLWSEALPTRITFITLLAMADREGFVYGSPVGLAAIARLSLEDTLAALKVLESPEPMSSDLMRNPEHEGRRIEPIEQGGWRILNYPYYRQHVDADERRFKTKQRVAKFRESKAVTPCNSGNPSYSDSEAGSEVEKEAEKQMEQGGQAALPGVPPRAAAAPKVRTPKPKGTRPARRPVALNPPKVAEVEEFVRARYPHHPNPADFAYRFVRKQTEVGWKDKQGRALVSWKATVDTWMDFETVAGR